MIRITVSGKVEAKGRGRVGRIPLKNGKTLTTVFTPTHTRKYENLIKHEAGLVMRGKEPIKGPVEVRVYVYIGLPKAFSKKKITDALKGLIKPCSKPDIDNYVKSALDGINTIVIADDNQVWALQAYKIYSSTPRLEIHVHDTDEERGLM